MRTGGANVIRPWICGIWQPPGHSLLRYFSPSTNDSPRLPVCSEWLFDFACVPAADTLRHWQKSNSALSYLWGIGQSEADRLNHDANALKWPFRIYRSNA